VERSKQETSSPLRSAATAGDVMQPAYTAIEPNDHLAAAAYLTVPSLFAGIFFQFPLSLLQPGQQPVENGSGLGIGRLRAVP
jgi:hypothetical protein